MAIFDVDIAYEITKEDLVITIDALDENSIFERKESISIPLEDLAVALRPFLGNIPNPPGVDTPK